MRIFFLTGEWTALERFVRGQVPEPEGMPSVYLPWLHYKKRGYDVHVFMLGTFEKRRTIDFYGCTIHLVTRSKFFQWRNKQKVFRCRFPADCYFLYKAAITVGKDIPPDIIYSLAPWDSYAAWALAKKYRSVCVKRIYGTWLYYDWFLSRSLRKKLGCLPHFLAWKVPSDMMIISNDGTGGGKLVDWLGIDTSKYCMWLNGVNKRWQKDSEDVTLAKENLAISADDFVLLSLSRLSKWKRQDRIIKAMPAILEKVPNAKLIVAGDGPMKEKLESIVNRLGLNSHVHFTGTVLHSKVHELISIADIFLQTNDLSCLGNTLLEALVCGRAIVTWDVGTTRDVISNGVNGCLLPDAEPLSVANAVIDLALNPEKRYSLAQGAHSFALEHLLSWDERLDKEIDLVESIIRNKK